MFLTREAVPAISNRFRPLRGLNLKQPQGLAGNDPHYPNSMIGTHAQYDRIDVDEV